MTDFKMGDEATIDEILDDVDTDNVIFLSYLTFPAALHLL